MNFDPRPLARTRRLPYNSRTLVAVGAKVLPNTVLATSYLPLPRQFYLYALRTIPWSAEDDSPDGSHYRPLTRDAARDVKPLSEQEVAGCYVRWQVKAGDPVKFGQVIVRFIPKPGSMVKEPRAFRAPMDGVVEEVFERSFYVLLREDVDYGRKQAEIPVGRALEARGWKLRRYLCVTEGAFVEKGQMIAKRLEPGNGYSSVVSPIAGMVESIDLASGIVLIKREFEDVPTFADFVGEVTAVRPGDIEMQGKGMRVTGVCGVGGESSGRLAVVAGTGEEITPSRIVESHAAAVIAGGKGIGLEALQRAAALGVRGVITGGIDQLDLCGFLQRDFAVSATGQEAAPFTVIITGRFGREAMNQEFHGLLTSCEGKWVSINGTTRIRAGVVRPEVLIFESD